MATSHDSGLVGRRSDGHHQAPRENRSHWRACAFAAPDALTLAQNAPSGATALAAPSLLIRCRSLRQRAQSRQFMEVE